MVRLGLAIMVLSVLLYLGGTQLTAAPPGTGANIGAGLLALVTSGVFLLGAVCAVTGVLRRLRSRRNTST